MPFKPSEIEAQLDQDFSYLSSDDRAKLKTVLKTHLANDGDFSLMGYKNWKATIASIVSNPATQIEYLNKAIIGTTFFNLNLKEISESNIENMETLCKNCMNLEGKTLEEKVSELGRHLRLLFSTVKPFASELEANDLHLNASFEKIEIKGKGHFVIATFLEDPTSVYYISNLTGVNTKEEIFAKNKRVVIEGENYTYSEITQCDIREFLNNQHYGPTLALLTNPNQFKPAYNINKNKTEKKSEEKSATPELTSKKDKIKCRLM